MVKRGKQRGENNLETPREATADRVPVDLAELNDDSSASRGDPFKGLNPAKTSTGVPWQATQQEGAEVSAQAAMGGGGHSSSAGQNHGVHSTHSTAAGASRAMKKQQRKTESSSPPGGGATVGEAPSSHDRKGGDPVSLSSAFTFPPLPCWAKEQRAALEAVTDDFYARHRLYLRVWPVTASPEENGGSAQLPKGGGGRKASGASGGHRKAAEEGPEDEAVKLRQEQLMNMRVMLHDRVAENLSFTRTQYNTATQPPRNRCLPSFLRPRSCRPPQGGAAPAPQNEASDKGLSPEKRNGGSGGCDCGDEAMENDRYSTRDDDVEDHDGESQKSVFCEEEGEPLAGGEDKINEIQKSLLAEGFTGCWVLLLSEKYIPPAEDASFLEQGQTSAKPAEEGSPPLCNGGPGAVGGGRAEDASSPRNGVTTATGATESASHAAPLPPPVPRVRRVIVCGALIEVYSNNERQISALWCLPCLSARSTRLLLQAFLPRLIIEALKLPDIQPPPLSRPGTKRAKKRQKTGAKHGENGVGAPGSDLEAVAASLRIFEDESDDAVVPPAPMKSVFAVCEDTLLWPRQALFLLAAPSKMGFLRHVEPLQPPPEPGAADAASGGGTRHKELGEQPQLHVDAGFGPQWRMCNCRQRFLPEGRAGGGAASRKERDSCGARSEEDVCGSSQPPANETSPRGGAAFLRFFSVSELWASRLMPPKEARARLEGEETTAARPCKGSDGSTAESPERDKAAELESGSVAGQPVPKTKKKGASLSSERNASVWPLVSDGWSCLVPRGTCEQLIEEIYGGLPYLRQYLEEKPDQTNVAEDEMCGLTEDECRAVLQW
ncbi:hypothetical protein BESB_035330 [Besnoitia besnoiti]|uniref:Uncharacterized protein n=1 Tax=Besnoitia besnoiti TaxID=94643 RepID=A0A2A9MGH0_BESBE|nr:hypothetical protein BESB_035330 [Besnoitia besnoiti]PFH37075.1 hypothetical protein BESB_035330 [Besnoitia besnoiti]